MGNKELIHRSISWDEESLRKLMKVGLKRDMVWREAWSGYCLENGLLEEKEQNPKSRTYEDIMMFIESNLGDVLGREWVKEFLVDPEVQRRKIKGDIKKKKKEKSNQRRNRRFLLLSHYGK